MSTHHQWFKNYDVALLGLQADQRGFIVGQSRLGITKLRSTLGSWVDILDGFTNISVNLACRVVDGAWIEPEVSTLALVTRDPDVFAVSDGDELHLAYDGASVFTGYVSESTLESTLDEDQDEEFTVVLTARGYEAIKNGQAAVGTATTLFSVNGGGGPVVQWAAGKVRERAEDITGRSVTAEDDRADVQLEERLGAETDVSGTQGELLADLAIRAGLLLDQSSGTGVSFRSYQSSPRWVLEDEHVVSGYAVAIDRQSTSSVVVTRKEDDDFVRAYRAGGQRVTAGREISTVSGNEWDMGSVPAYTPLVARPGPFLARARVPRSDDLPLVSRLPILARYRHDGTTYEGAVVGMSHSIGKDRWMIDLTCEPGQLVTRESQLNPTPPQHVRISVDAGTATLNWSDGTLGVAQGTPALASYFVLPEAARPDVAVGDELRVYADTGAEKEDTIFTVTAVSVPAFGYVNVSISPEPVTKIVQNDVVRFAHYGPTPLGWVVWYQRILPNIDNRAIGPNSTGFAPQSKIVYQSQATITGLTSAADYRFSVYAFAAEPNVRSAPSDWVSTTTVDPEGLELITSGVDDDSVDLDWTWTGGTITGYRVGRDGVDSTGYGEYETTFDTGTLTVTFDKLVAGTTYNVFVAALNGTTEMERVTDTITTTGTAPGEGGGGPGPLPGEGEEPLPGDGRIVSLVGFSGLLFNSVCFLPDTTGAGAAAFGVTRGRAMDGLLTFTPRQTWEDFRFRMPDHRAWVQSGHLLITSHPHAPESEGSAMNQRGANNDYAVQQRAYGAWLASAGFNVPNHVIRLDWECNGDWYGWSMKNGGPGVFKRAYQNAVTNIRAGGGTKVKFNLCFNKGPSQAGADFAGFPGAEYCDVIGIDDYDWWTATFSAGDRTSNETRTPGLKTARDFAVANGIMWSWDEGGNIHVSPGGFDNPLYWQYAWDFLTDPDNYPSCAWHNTYNQDGAPNTLHHSFSFNPDSFAYYTDNRWGNL